MRIAIINLIKHRPHCFDIIEIEDTDGNIYSITDTELEVFLEQKGLKEYKLERE